METVYEGATNRVVKRRFGGLVSDEALYEEDYEYLAANESPWPDSMTRLESVPGGSLTPTWTTSWQRDALGRPVREARSDGRVLERVYDRSGPVIQTRTGAGTTTSSSLDSRGLEVARFLPNGRGNKLMSYGFDGRPLVSESANESGTPWRMSYQYDTTGRVITGTHADGTSESYTYNPDNTVATRTTREGVLVTYAYDPANRVLSAVPTAGGALPSNLVPAELLQLPHDRNARLAGRGVAERSVAVTALFRGSERILLLDGFGSKDAAVTPCEHCYGFVLKAASLPGEVASVSRHVFSYPEMTLAISSFVTPSMSADFTSRSMVASPFSRFDTRAWLVLSVFAATD